MDLSSLHISTSETEGLFHASKWLKHQILISTEEMASLLEAIGSCFICHASGPALQESLLLTPKQVLDAYAGYIQAIRQGDPVNEKELRRLFCNYLTYDLDALYGVKVSGDRMILKAILPVVQMQLHHFFPSTVDGKFHSMVMTQESVHWGIQLSYPQIFEDPKTHEFFKVTDCGQFPNTALFKTVIKWIRLHTVPTPMIFQGVRTRVPFRLGKSCFSWINAHQQLKAHAIFVEQ
ncbi:MAG: hypothetical protein WCG14_02455 [Chlamydiia bacterium]